LCLFFFFALLYNCRVDSSQMPLNRTFEFRCPIHGFIQLSAWERDIVNQAPFQRLRRIRQLAWTDYVYPGAMHTRFEHSLGVMHVATKLYESIMTNSRAILDNEYSWNAADHERNEQIVRLAALLHDVGHSPFSHASEELFPTLSDKPNKRHKHEEYSSAIIRGPLAAAIEQHPENSFKITADEVASIIEGKTKLGNLLFWKDIIAGQLDADRMDYLIRDSHHLGVQYGRFDVNRVIASMTTVPSNDDGAPRIGIQEGGWRAAESLILARYSMFTQVYFHKTRIAYDHHLFHAMKEILPGGCFPRFEGQALADYMRWDDWKVLGALSEGHGGEHAERLRQRNHYRKVFGNPESSSNQDTMLLLRVSSALGDLVVHTANSEKSWYKPGPSEIPVLDWRGTSMVVNPLSQYSRIVRSIESASGEILLYTRPEDVAQAISIINEVTQNDN